MTETAAPDLLLIDLSSLAYPIWAMSQQEPDPDYTSQKIVSRIHDLSAGCPRAAVCCDSGRSFRYDIDPEYKGNRPEKQAPMLHQIDVAIAQLRQDGFQIWKSPNVEADDIIGTAVTKALALPDLTVMIVTADKDLLQLVGPRVTVKSSTTGNLLDDAAVQAKFGVGPSQIVDYLTFVGDPADNIKGAKGIGPQKAAHLLTRFGSLDKLYDELGTTGAAALGLPLGVAKALKEFMPKVTATRQLITLKTDVDIPFDEIVIERTPVATGAFTFGDDEPVPAPIGTTDLGDLGIGTTAVREAIRTAAEVEEPAPEPTKPRPPVDAPQQPTITMPDLNRPPTAMQRLDDGPAYAPPVEWERQLDPRSLREAQLLAVDMHKSHMFDGYGTPQAVLSTILVGRELGLPAMASLRCIHNIQGKHALSAQLIVALVLKSKLAEYFDCLEVDDQHAVFETHRKGSRQPMRLTHTIPMAEKAGLVKPGSNWVKIPQDMLVARCSVRLARLVYPDIVSNIYSPDELEDFRK